MASFWKPEACGQTVLPDRSVLIEQKMVENAKMPKFKCDILSSFQTMWINSIRQNTFVNTVNFCCSTNYIDRNNLRVCFSSLYSQNMSYEWYALVKSFDFVLRNKVFCSTTLRLAFIVGLLLAFFANLKNVSETCRRVESLSDV